MKSHGHCADRLHPWCMVCVITGLLWSISAAHAQVQRYSGAFLMSARKQGTGLRTPSSAVKTAGGYSGSPGWSPAAASATAVQLLLGREASGQLPGSAEDEDLGELAEDEEFAVEEHAHRSIPLSRISCAVDLLIIWRRGVVKGCATRQLSTSPYQNHR